MDFSKNIFRKKIKSIFIFNLLFLIPIVNINADPFIEICNFELECQYIEAGPEVNGCSGSDIVLYAIDPNNETCTGIVTYQWYTYDFYNTGSGWDYGWIKVLGATDNRYEVNNHDTFPYRCEVTCDESSYLTSEVEVSYNSTPPSIISHPEDVEICEGIEVYFEGLGNGSQIVYQWETKTPNGLWEVLEGEILSTLIYIPITEDDGRLFRLKISNNCAYTVTASANLTVNAKPQPDLGPDISICEGSSYDFQASESYASYLWSTGYELSTLTVNESGSYTLLVSNNNSCEGSDTVYLNVDPALPEFDLGENIKLCSGETANIGVSLTFDNYLWNNNSDQQSINVSESGEYWVTVSSDNNTCESSDTILVEISEPYNKDNICMITTDQSSGKNLIIWERTPNVGIVSYNIYRQSTVLGEYDWIGNQSANELSTFEDLEADPEVRQWVYKITAIDTCGNESDIEESSYHIPLFLQYVSSDNGVNLTWVPYEVQNGNIDFVSYIIFRGSDSLKLENIGEISSDLNVYRDTDPNALSSKFYYRVAGVKASACVPENSTKSGSGPFIHSLSNLEDNRISPSTSLDINNLSQVKLYPNPFSDFIRIELTNPKDFNQLRILDLSGKIVYQISKNISAYTRIPRGELQAGVYILEIQGKKIFREKIIVKL